MEEIYKNLDLNNLEGEEWRDVEGFEGKYQVSNMGRVKSLNYNHTKQEKILRQGKLKNGYLYVILYRNGKMKNFLVHRLVGNAFIENPNGYRCFNHKNEIKTDNRAENLEPCDYQYNNTYGSRTAKAVEKLTNGVLSKKVYQYSIDGKLIKIWASTQECRRNGYNRGNIAACCRNCYAREGNNIYKNYIWSYTPIDSK